MLGQVTTEAAERFGERTAYVSAGGWTVSYADLDRMSDEVAAGLLRRGVGDGDVVALVLPGCPDHFVAYIAAAKIGAVTAGVNPRLSSAERAGVIGRADPTLTVATADLAPDDGPGDLVVVEPAERSDSALTPLRIEGGVPPPLREDPERPVAIVFTSGTTGAPKGAVFADRQLEFITEVDTGHRWGGGGAALAGTALAHLGPTTKLPGALHRGGTTHFVERWTPAAALEMVERHAMSGIGGIPTQVALMLRHPTFDATDVSSVQAIVIGGGPATPALVREARAGFGAALSVRYSCTEAGIGVGTALTDPPEDAEVSVGRPHAGVDLVLVDDDLRPVPMGEVGEVCLGSAAVMTGYHRDPEGTAGAFTPDGAVRTGDLGHLDEAGRLHLVGRAKEMYVRGGYNVYPMEVEAVLAEHPRVADIAVAARADEVMGEVGVAVVVPIDADDPPSLDDLCRFGGLRLAHHKLPEAIAYTEALPLTPMEKVDRRALVAHIS